MTASQESLPSIDWKTLEERFANRTFERQQFIKVFVETLPSFEYKLNRAYHEYNWPALTKEGLFMQRVFEAYAVPRLAKIAAKLVQATSTEEKIEQVESLLEAFKAEVQQIMAAYTKRYGYTLTPKETDSP